MLLKDGLLDEDAHRQQQNEHDSDAERLEKLESSLDILQSRFARLLAEYVGAQQKLKQRLTLVEKRQSTSPDDTDADTPHPAALAPATTDNSSSIRPSSAPVTPPT